MHSHHTLCIPSPSVAVAPCKGAPPPAPRPSRLRTPCCPPASPRTPPPPPQPPPTARVAGGTPGTPRPTAMTPGGRPSPSHPATTKHSCRIIVCNSTYHSCGVASVSRRHQLGHNSAQLQQPLLCRQQLTDHTTPRSPCATGACRPSLSHPLHWTSSAQVGRPWTCAWPPALSDASAGPSCP